MKTDSAIIQHMFFRLLPVQILLVAIGSLNSIVDGAMAGQLLGSFALVATGLFAPLFRITETINTVMLSGASILCGKLLGKNQTERTGNVFSLDILLMLLISLGFSTACFFAPEGIAQLLGASNEGIGHLADYIRGYAFAFVPSLIAAQLCVFLQLERQEKRIYTGIGVMLASNIALDYLFVAQLKYGMFGLGLATTLSSLAFLLVLLSWYLSGKAVIRFSVRNLQGADLKEILYVGMPGAVGQFCLTIRSIGLNYLILIWVGNAGMSAFSAVNTFGGLFYAATAGVASATRILVSVYLGEEDRTGLLLIMRTALINGVLLVAAAAAVFILLAVPITGIFYPVPSGEVYDLTLWGFRLFPVSMPLSCFCVIFVNYYQCRKKIGIVNILSAADGVVGTVLTAMFLLPLQGGMGIWTTQILNGVYTTFIVLIYAVLLNRRRPRSMDELITLPKDFGVGEDCRMDRTIRSVPEVINLSVQVIDFCEKHGIDRKRAAYAGLCIEEMAGNIVDHGFRKDSKQHSVDVRVVYSEGGLLLRLRDDCRTFNPKEREELFDPSDITRNIGIRMISRIAGSMTYQNLLGMNVLTIRV